MKTIDEILRMFCSNDETRAILNNPFNCGDYTYATNGHFGIRVPIIKGYEHCTKYDMDKMGFKQIADEHYKPIPDVEKLVEFKRCPECKGIKENYTCPDCGGSKQVFWESETSGIEYEAECKMCVRDVDGVTKITGIISGKCGYCRGQGKVSSVRYIDIGTKRMDAELLRIISTLPDVVMALEYGEPLDPILFKFTGGDGILMPLRHIKESIKSIREVPVWEA